MRRRLCVLIQVGIATLLVGPSVAMACTCADPGRVTEDKVIDAMCEVDVVFVGEATDQLSAQNQNRRVKLDPAVVYKGGVSGSIVVETATTCDHWFSLDEKYLVFGNIDESTNRLTTSICGPSRFTSNLKNAEFQLQIIKARSADVDELCGVSESRARRLRILAQDRNDRMEAEAEALHLLKEGISQSRVEYEQALESAKPAQEEEE